MFTWSNMLQLIIIVFLLPVRLRDTFAGKIFLDFWCKENVSEKRSEFYRQKCRAGVRTKLLFLVIIINHLHI